MRVEDLLILIVDDDPKDLLGLKHSLLALGAQLQTLDDPQKVLSEVESQRPDLIVLDALLPGVSGFDLCKQIKTDSKAQDTLVVIITGVYLKEQYRRDALHSFKADGFLTKPCRPVELQRVVLGLLAKKHNTTPSALAGKAKRPVAEPEPSPTEMAQPPEPADIADSAGAAREEELSRETDEKDDQEDLHQEEEGGKLEGGQVDTADGVDEFTEIREVETVEQTDEVDEGQPATPPEAEPPHVEGAPRPRAINKGVPIYEEEGFHFELRREVAKCQRLGRPLTLILIRGMDLDQIVELVGTGFRRQVLWHVAEQALASLRDVDVAGELSSQELVGLIAFASGRYGGRRIVSRVERAVTRRPFKVGEGLPAIVPALRFGIAAFPKEAKDVDALIGHARRELLS